MAPFFAEQTYHLPDLVEIDPTTVIEDAGSHLALYTPGGDESDDDLRDLLAEALPRTTVYRRGRMPERLYYERAGTLLGDIIIVPDMGWSVLPWAVAGVTIGLAHPLPTCAPSRKGLPSQDVSRSSSTRATYRG